MCGAHRLALVGFPTIAAGLPQPFGELLGVTEPRPDTPPAVGCLACGAEWPDLQAFRATRRAAREGGRGR